MAKHSASVATANRAQLSGLDPQLGAIGDLSSLASDYGKDLVAAQHVGGLAAGTVSEYMGHVNAFVDFAYNPLNDVAVNVADITTEHIKLFVRHVCEINTGQTPNQRYGKVKMFFAWLVDECEITANPFIKRNGKPIDAPVIPERITRIPEVADVKRMVEQYNGKDFASVRDNALLRLFASTGCRIDEITKLHFDPSANFDPNITPHIDLEQNIVYVLGKGRGRGKRFRPVSFDEATAQALRRYKRAREKELANKPTSTMDCDCETKHTNREALWIGTRGAKQLRMTGIRMVITEAGRKVGIKVHPHMFRHYDADNCKAANMSDEDNMARHGWINPATMQRYGAANRQKRSLAAARRLDIRAF
jgi:site-specific recombinase XerD